MARNRHASFPHHIFKHTGLSSSGSGGGAPAVNRFNDVDREINSVEALRFYTSNGDGFDAEIGNSLEVSTNGATAPTEDLTAPYTDGVSKATKFVSGGKFLNETVSSALVQDAEQMIVLAHLYFNNAGEVAIAGNHNWLSLETGWSFAIEGARRGFTISASQVTSPSNSNRKESQTSSYVDGTWNTVMMSFNKNATSIPDEAACAVNGVDKSDGFGSFGGLFSTLGTVDGSSPFCIGSTSTARAGVDDDFSIGLFAMWAANDLGLPNDNTINAHLASLCSTFHGNMPI